MCVRAETRLPKLAHNPHATRPKTDAPTQALATTLASPSLLTHLATLSPPPIPPLQLQLESLYQDGKLGKLWALASQTDFTINLVRRRF